MSWFFLLAVLVATIRYVMRKKHPTRGDGEAYAIFAGIFFGIGGLASGLAVYGWLLLRAQGYRVPGLVPGAVVLAVLALAGVAAVRAIRKPGKGRPAAAPPPAPVRRRPRPEMKSDPLVFWSSPSRAVSVTKQPWAGDQDQRTET